MNHFRAEVKPRIREFPHAMLAEIYEQPAAIRRTIELYCDGEGLLKEEE